MKKVSGLIVSLLLSASLFAQVPQGFNYQAVYRDVSGNIIPDENVAVIISILQGDVDGTVVFTEAHIASTNNFGLLNLTIGSVNTTDLPTIDWSDGPYFLKVNINGNPMGVTQLLSVPFAMHSATAESVTGGITESDPLFSESLAAGIVQGDIDNWEGSYKEGDKIDVAEVKINGTTVINSSAEWVGPTIDETDPAFMSSPSADISETDKNNWNDAYGWGDHEGLYADIDHTHNSSMFPPGSIPVIYGETKDFINGMIYYKDFPEYASDIGTTNQELHAFLDQVRYAGNGIDWVQTFGGDNYGNGLDDKSWAAVAVFVKNTTGSPIIRNMCFALSSSNTISNYASVALNGTDIWTYSSNNLFESYCMDITFPANSTSVLVIKCGSYNFTTWNGYWNRVLIGILGSSLDLDGGLEFDYQRYSDFISNQ